eukprot:5683442-Amphidinium_carterae.1
MNCSHVHSRQWLLRRPVPQTRYKTKRTSTTTVTSSCLNGQVRSTDKAPRLHLAQFVRKTDKWQQRPVRSTDWENSSGLYIACSFILACPTCQLTTER